MMVSVEEDRVESVRDVCAMDPTAFVRTTIVVLVALVLKIVLMREAVDLAVDLALLLN